MEEVTNIVAKSLSWVHRNSPTYGGDPNQIFAGGHSASSKFASLICIDDRYLNNEYLSFEVLKGCMSIGADTHEIPKIIMTAKHRQTLNGDKMFTFGHRQTFGNDPEKHVNLSSVTELS